MSAKYYVTSPIYYVNDKPHIGHAYTTICCDIIARIRRLSGMDVFFMTGTDEHGQKIQRSSQNAGIKTQDFVDQMSANFANLANMLNASYDIFLRTSNEHHKNTVLEIWSQLIKTNDIYIDKYSGWYSVRDEAFYDENELDDNKLAPSGSPVEWLEEECYFFRLSKWEKPLLDFYAQYPNFVFPDYRFNEVINFVKSGLKDLAVSRTGINWGIKVPGNEKHVIYVWLDALSSYLSAIKGSNLVNNTNFWPANAHVVGKDILRFHAVYWPAFLMALNLELPKHIVSHGWWLNEGQKISKSVGNVIDPVALIEEFGLDSVRYFLIREISFGSDGNFSRSKMINRINAELNNKIGNLCQRVFSFIYKQAGGSLPKLNATESYKQDLLIKAVALIKLIPINIENFALHTILDAIIHLTDEANKYIDEKAPWKLIKSDQNQAISVLATLCEVIRYIAIALQPFIPDSAAKILQQLSVPLDQRSFRHLTQEFALQSITILDLPIPIFKKINYDY